MKKKNRFIAILVALILVVVLFGVAACGKKADTTDQTGTGKPTPTQTLKLGFIMPMSGAGSLWGIAIEKHVNAYAALINEDGGLKIGDEYYTIENYFADDEGLPDNAATATNQLIERNNVQGILGYWGVGNTIITSIATPNKVYTNFTNPINFNPQQAPYASFAKDDSVLSFAQLYTILKAFPNTKVLGISANEYYYAGVGDKLDLFKEILTEHGVGYFEDIYPWGTMDYTTHLEKLRKGGVDTVYSWAPPQEEAMKEKEIYEKKLQMNFAGAGTIVDLKSYIELSGYEAAQGGLHPHNYPWDLQTYNIKPEIVELSLKIKAMDEKLTGKPFDYDGSFSYGLNSMLMYFQALQRAGTTDPAEVMRATEGGTFDLFTGTQTLGGKATYGRAVLGHNIGPMGKVVGYMTEYLAEGPAIAIP